MDLSKKSKSFMISDILTVPLNLSSTCSGRSSDSDKASAVLQFTSSGHVDHQIPDRKNTSPPSSAVIDKGRDSDIRRISPPITQKSIPKLVAPIGMRQTQFGSQILMQNCLFPTGFHDYGKIKSFGLGNEFRAGHTISPEQKSLAGCFCSMPYCSAPNLGVPCPDPLGFDHDAPPVPIPIPLYVRTRFSNAADLLKAKRCRRSRTVFTELQLMGLEKKFETQKYLSTPDRVELADRLGLSQIQVKTWYQNRRMKWKKQVMQDGGTEPPTKPKGRPKKSFLVAAAASANESKARETTLVANVTIETDCHENIFVDDDIDSVIPDI